MSYKGNYVCMFVNVSSIWDLLSETAMVKIIRYYDIVSICCIIIPFAKVFKL